MTSRTSNTSSTKRFPVNPVKVPRGGSPDPPRNPALKRGGSGDPPRKTYLKPLSPWAGGVAAFPSRVRGGGRAFTLIELITVMAIMATLMAMIVGVAPQIQDAWRARITRTRLLAVVSALQAYAGDYNGKYPGPAAWATTGSPIRDVTTTTGFKEWDVLFQAVKPSSAWEYYEEAILYAALISATRRGPYYKAAGGQTVVRKDGIQEFNLLADGWERPILYEYSTTTGLLVRSLGKDGATGGDDIDYFVFQN